MSLAALKKASSDLESLNQKINTMMNPGRDNDPRFWQPTVDKAGNGTATIRFLPVPEVDEVPFVRIYDHGFKGPGGWYIENSLTTIDKNDPVTDYNNSLFPQGWDNGRKEDKDFVSGTPGSPGSKRRLHFYSNILVIDDPAEPKNNGHVFIYRYGKKIYEKLQLAQNPKFPNQPKFNPYDMWNGANFVLRIMKVDDQRNYSESSFDPCGPVAKTDKEIEAIWKQTYSLKEFVDPKNFKSYEELQAKFDRIMRTKPTRKSVEQDEPIPQNFGTTGKVVDAPVASEAGPPWEDNGDEETTKTADTDELAKFRKLVNG